MKWAELARGEISSATFDYRTKDKDGFHYFRLSSSIDRSDPRQVVFTGVVQDITDIRRIFDQLKDQQNLWEKVINSIPLCFLWQVFFVNPVFYISDTVPDDRKQF